MYEFGDGVVLAATAKRSAGCAKPPIKETPSRSGTSGPCTRAVCTRAVASSQRSEAEAVQWYRKSAEQGNPLAQVQLGVRYAEGHDVPKDDVEAARWYRKAAEQGDGDGQSLLGTEYSVGVGVSKDYVQAYMWLNLAAGSGDNTAAKERDDLEHSMTVEQIAKAQQQTAAWRPTRSGKQQPACSKDEQELTRLARENGYQYNFSCN